MTCRRYTFLAERAGPFSLRLRRAIAVLVGPATAGVTFGSWFSVTATASIVSTTVFWLLIGPALCLPLFAACAASCALWAARGSDRGTTELHNTPRRWVAACDHAWQLSLLLLLIGYGCAVILTATTPLLPSQEATLTPRTTPLSGYFIVIGIVAPVILRWKVAVVYVVALVPPLIVMLAASRGQVLLFTVEEPLLFLGMVLAQIGGLGWALGQGDVLDRARHESRVQAIHLAVEQARIKACHKANCFIHDHILSVLVSAGAGLGDSEQLRATARTALLSLQEPYLRRPDTEARQMLRALAQTAQSLNAGVSVSMSLSAASSVPVPSEVAQGLHDATLEAIRNSMRHASTPGAPKQVSRHLRLMSDQHTVTITVSDDGCGFDPDRLTPDRHGLTGSIRQRLHDVGASVNIRSSPGQGTTVAIAWQWPEAGNTQSTARSITPQMAWPHRLATSMETTAARLIGLYNALIHCLIALLEIHAGAYTMPGLVVAGLLFQILGGWLLLRSWPQAQIPPWAVSLIPVLVAASHLAVLFPVAHKGWPGFAAWATGTATILCCGLLMRQCPKAAWAGMAALVATTAIWVILTSRPYMLIPAYMLAHLVTLSLWHLITYSCTIASAALVATERRNEQILAMQQANQAARQAMDNAMAAVRQRTMRLLTRITQGGQHTSDMQNEARLLEAELRDEIRAPFFTGTSVVAAAKQARNQGAEVLLLDDSGGAAGLPEIARQNALIHVTSVLHATTSGRVVIRINPPGRTAVLSVVTDDGGYQLAQDGRTMPFDLECEV